MLYRTMKKNGDKLSILGFGCMRLPEKNGKIDEDRASQQLHHAIDNGVNYIDTAMFYHRGTSESFLGRALSGSYRERVKLATKLPYWNAKDRNDMDNLLRAQLSMLKTDHIDYYLIHNLNGPGWKTMQDLGIIDFIERAKRDGRIVNCGFSFHSTLHEFKMIINNYDWDFCQIQYNYLDEQNQAGTEGLEYASSKGLGVIIMEPLRGGILAGKVPPSVQEIWDRVEIRRTPAEWALRWVWNRPEVTVVLSGMNNERHIEENLLIACQALPGSLSNSELDLIRDVVNKYRTIMKVGCTGCRYCMPCPSGVDIPTCFEIYNSGFMMGNRKEAMYNYLGRCTDVLGKDNPSYASLCRQCGLCEKHCPQEIKIRSGLKDVAKEFEGVRFTITNLIGRHLFARMRRRDLRMGRTLS